MSEIPLEVQMHAERLYDEGGYEAVPTIIAKAIMAERQRCLDHCDYVRENIKVRNSDRKRFDIYDLNQNFKGAVGCVRERIAGDWEKNWKPDPDAPSPEQTP